MRLRGTRDLSDTRSLRSVSPRIPTTVRAPLCEPGFSQRLSAPPSTRPPTRASVFPPLIYPADGNGIARCGVQAYDGKFSKDFFPRPYSGALGLTKTNRKLYEKLRQDRKTRNAGMHDIDRRAEAPTKKKAPRRARSLQEYVYRPKPEARGYLASSAACAAARRATGTR